MTIHLSFRAIFVHLFPNNNRLIPVYYSKEFACCNKNLYNSEIHNKPNEIQCSINNVLLLDTRTNAKLLWPIF